MENKSGFVAPLERLAEQFKKLPGIGKKSAYRLAYHVLDYSDAQAQSFADAILDAKRLICRCSVCQNISDSEVCSICSQAKRNKNLICLVEDPRDVAAIEKLGEFDGVYHVLGGVLSPLDGKGPDKLKIPELLKRIEVLRKENGDEYEIEVIAATNPNVEGEATAMYISRLLKPLGVKVTRLAKGIPVGGDLEYADDVTLFKAIEGRVEM
ncbi:MAG: recombination protein RecR [Ruminococcaceae bacterium]|nr:recombination protein RecR [Oscillospiraceae bacterium]